MTVTSLIVTIAHTLVLYLPTTCSAAQEGHIVTRICECTCWWRDIFVFFVEFLYLWSFLGVRRYDFIRALLRKFSYVKCILFHFQMYILIIGAVYGELWLRCWSDRYSDANVIRSGLRLKKFNVSINCHKHVLSTNNYFSFYVLLRHEIRAIFMTQWWCQVAKRCSW
jgi:hypothetical protein